MPIPPPMLKNSIPHSDFNLPDQRHHFFDRLYERFDLGDLRSDVHLHAANLDVAHPFRPVVDLRYAIDRDAEFVLSFTGTDVFVGVR